MERISPAYRLSIQTHHIKRQKLPTPLDASQYPVTQWNEMSPTLQQRLLELRAAVCDTFGWERVDMWLTGSQVSGKSASGNPDIDVVYYHPSIHKYTPQTIHQNCFQIAQKISFKLDGGPCRTPFPRDGRGIPGYRGAYIRVWWPDEDEANDVTNNDTSK